MYLAIDIQLRAQPNLHHRPEPEFTFPKEYCKMVENYELTFIAAEQIENEESAEQSPKIESQMFEEQIRQLKNTNMPLITLPIIKVMTIYLYNVNQLVGSRRDVMQTVENISVRLVNFINKNYAKILKQFQNSSAYFVRKEIPDNETYCDY